MVMTEDEKLTAYHEGGSVWSLLICLVMIQYTKQQLFQEVGIRHGNEFTRKRQTWSFN